MKKVAFESENIELVGNLYYPPDYTEGRQYPAVIVSGSWTTVKEQMAGLYAKRLSKKGYITLAFDFRGFGESGGEPRFYENPAMKVEDIKNAVGYLASLPEVDMQNIGLLGICAGAGYSLVAASEDKRVKAVVTVASWLHAAEAVKLFYGGEAGVKTRLKAAQNAKRRYEESGETDYVPTVSTTDDSAAMFGEYDYYLNPGRGAIKEWSGERFATMSWEPWLTFDPMKSAPKLTAPTLMIHSDGAVLPDYTKKYFDAIATDDKKLHWIDTEIESPFHQFSFYDQEEEVALSVDLAAGWFSKKIPRR
ncbi:MAG: alpha/beta hydrolase [Campylobacterales bacterium]